MGMIGHRDKRTCRVKADATLVQGTPYQRAHTVKQPARRLDTVPPVDAKEL